MPFVADEEINGDESVSPVPRPFPDGGAGPAVPLHHLAGRLTFQLWNKSNPTFLFRCEVLIWPVTATPDYRGLICLRPHGSI